MGLYPSENPQPGRKPNGMPSGNALTNNLLAGATPAAPQPGTNMLTGAPVQMASQPQSQPAPSSPPSQPAPATVPGQAMSSAIGKAIGAGKLSDNALAEQFNRLDYMRNAIGSALQKPNLSHDDAVKIVAEAVRDKVVPASEAGEILSGVTSDPTKLRAELQQRHLVAVHGLVHLAGEKNQRDTMASLRLPDDQMAAGSAGVNAPPNASPSEIRQATIQRTVANLGGPAAVARLYGAPSTGNK